MKKLILPVLISLIFTACKKEEIQTSSQPPSNPPIKKDIRYILNYYSASGEFKDREDFGFTDGLFTSYYQSDGGFYTEYIISYDSLRRPVKVEFAAINVEAVISYSGDSIILVNTGQSRDYTRTYLLNSDGRVTESMRIYNNASSRKIKKTYTYINNNLTQVDIIDSTLSGGVYVENVYSETASYDNGVSPFERSGGDLVVMEYIFDYQKTRIFALYSKNNVTNYFGPGNNINQTIEYRYDNYPSIIHSHTINNVKVEERFSYYF